MARKRQEEKKPVHTIRSTAPGSVLELNVWENQVTVDSGRTIEVHAVSFSRSYKDGSDWKKTSNLRKGDLLTLAHMLGQAFDWLSEE